jgi:CheY-like chemotaxis protein
MSKTIVWIEDDTDIIDPVVKPLERAGHRFVRLHTAQEALDALDDIRQADLILLDIIFPPAPSGFDQANGFNQYTGLHLLHELREVHGVHIPVVVLTVVIRPELDKELEALNVADIIHKPVRPSELKQRVEAVWNISS